MLLEEIALARNRTQHPENIVSIKPAYSAADLKKLPRTFFVSDTEREMFSRNEGPEIRGVFEPSVHVTRDKLVTTFEEVEKIADWLETTIQKFQSNDR